MQKLKQIPKRVHHFLIGLVLTAKSIARYDRISKDKDFAEYYLLGTLLSTAIAIVAAFGVKTAW